LWLTIPPVVADDPDKLEPFGDVPHVTVEDRTERLHGGDAPVL
jgi:hypothetical protein